MQQQTWQTFTQKPGWNKRILGEIQYLLNKNPVTSIKEERVCAFGNIISSGKDMPHLKENQSQATILDVDFIAT